VRILVAEDNAFNRAVLLAALRKGGHELVVAADGQEALEAYDRGSFDLVLLDVEMPRLSGLEVAAAIRRRGGRARIVALTGAEGLASVKACQAAGMDGHLTKPVRPATIWQDIERSLGPEPIEHRFVDRAAVLEEAGGDRALVRRLMGLFDEQAAELEERLRRALDADDLGEVGAAAHALKSVCGHWSRGDAFTLAARLEAAARGADLRAARTTYAELPAALARLAEELAAAFPEESGS
jgi:two-component system sensor histidine kinase/response regulator